MRNRMSNKYRKFYFIRHKIYFKMVNERNLYSVGLQLLKSCEQRVTELNLSNQFRKNVS